MFTSPLTAHHRQAMQQQNQHQHQYQSSSYQNNYQSSYGVATASPQSIFGGSAPSPASSTSSSPTNFTMPVNLPVMEGWPPGAFHRFRWCYVNEGSEYHTGAATSSSPSP